MPDTRLNRRLSTLDAGFLYGEKPTQPMHVGGCMVFDGPISRQELLRVLQERMHLLPRYRQRVVFPPFGIAHPTWEDDPDFDLARHVDEVTLPQPADDRTLAEVGGRLYAPMLDRNHPLWQLILIQGLPENQTALLWKVHHAMVDGVSSVELAMTLTDLRPDAPPPPPPDTPWRPQPLPDALTLLQDAVRDQLTNAAERWTEESFRYLRPSQTQERVEAITNAITSAAPSALQPAPPTPFNAPVSGERLFAWAELSFAEVRACKSALGGTVNDAVLAILSGALGRYLRRHSYNTDGVVLRAMCPVSMRRAEERGALGNLVSIMIAPLYVGIDDPVERLSAERTAMDRLKEQDQAGGLYEMSSLAEQVPPAWQAAAASLPIPTQSFLNTVSTNVPGPQIPLYLAGRKLVHWYPLGIISVNIGLFVAILSYDRKLTFGMLVDPKLAPDVWDLAQDIKDSFAELREAALRVNPHVASAQVSVEQLAESARRASQRASRKAQAREH